MSRKCSSQRCPGDEIPEIFEKSIDKHKIDAILDAPSRRAGLFGLLYGRSVKAGGFGKEESGSHPDTGTRRDHRSICMLAHGGMNGVRVMRPVGGGVL